MNFYQQLKKNSLKKYLLFLIILYNLELHSQTNKIECDTISLNTNYYQITILKKNNQQFIFNVIGENIDFYNLPKDNLQSFINQLFVLNKFSPIILNKEFYLKNCNINFVTKKEELKLKNYFEDLYKKKKLKENIVLMTGEKILINGLNFKGLILVVNNQKLEFNNISLYPEEIYDCKEIKEYYIPLLINNCR